MGKPGPKPGSTLTLPPHDTITEGDAIGVLLSNRPDRVWLDRADYDRIVAAHGHRAWSWVEADRYVRIRLPGGTSAPVARVVLKSQGGGCVQFADADRLNLRRRNLSIQVKRAPYAPRQVRVRGQPNAPRRPAPRPSLKPSEPQEAPTLRPFPQAAPKLTTATVFKMPERPPITVVRAVKRDRQR